MSFGVEAHPRTLLTGDSRESRVKHEAFLNLAAQLRRPRLGDRALIGSVGICRHMLTYSSAHWYVQSHMLPYANRLQTGRPQDMLALQISDRM